MSESLKSKSLKVVIEQIKIGIENNEDQDNLLNIIKQVDSVVKINDPIIIDFVHRILHNQFFKNLPYQSIKYGYIVGVKSGLDSWAGDLSPNRINSILFTNLESAKKEAVKLQESIRESIEIKGDKFTIEELEEKEFVKVWRYSSPTSIFDCLIFIQRVDICLD